jgi:hypothetical protein
LSDETSIDLREVDAARGDGDPGGRPSILRARLASSLQAVSPDVVVVRYQGGGCLAWDLETGTVSVLQEEPKGSAGGGKPAPEIRIEERGFLVAASPDGGVRLSSLDKGEILLTLLFFEDDQWLVFEAGLGYLASGDAPDHLRLVTGGKAYPLTCYSGLLWSSFSVGSRLAGRPLPTPKILPPPGVEVVEEAPGREGTPTRLVITARDPVGIVSIVVVQGERETIYPGEGSQEVRVVHAVSADGAPGRLAVTAVNAMNVASSAVRRVDRDPKR